MCFAELMLKLKLTFGLGEFLGTKFTYFYQIDVQYLK